MVAAHRLDASPESERGASCPNKRQQLPNHPNFANADGAARAFLGTRRCTPPHCRSGGCAPHVMPRSSGPVTDRETRPQPRDDATVRLEWNALRVGDKVLVHDPGDPAMQLLPGVVAMVQTMQSSNDIGVRVAPRSDRRSVLRPRRLAVHLDPRDTTEGCWRCDAIGAVAGRGRDPAITSAP